MYFHFMKNDVLFYLYPSDEFNKGYAVCLSCGKADSIARNGDFLIALDPTRDHMPITSHPKSKDADGTQLPCSGSATVQRDIHLGCHSKTDVFEITLRNPVTQETIDDTPQGRTVAMVLAVAMRNALGVSVNEMGYSIRPSKVITTQQTALVIQLFDNLSGGAGFASSAAQHIQQLLIDSYGLLQCRADCDDVCSTCLLDSTTRHDADNLNRHEALSWLGDQFESYIELPAQLHLLPGSAYCHTSAREMILREINHGATRVTLWFGNDINEWDLSASAVNRLVHQYLTIHKINLAFVIPDIALDDTIKYDLRRFTDWGVELFHCARQPDKGYIVAVIEGDGSKLTLATTCDQLTNPDEQWLIGDSDTSLIQSSEAGDFALTPLDSRDWVTDSVRTNAVLAITAELNGPVTAFGKAFWQQLSQQFEPLQQALATQKLVSISYSDRYLQSPWSLMLLAEIINTLPNTHKPALTINTLFARKDRQGYQVHHDWLHESDFAEVYQGWFKHVIGLPVTLNIATARHQLAHRRLMVLQFASGLQVMIRFDQGVGYWVLERNLSNAFDFAATAEEQCIQIAKLSAAGKIKNSFGWSTDVYLSVND
jgi:DEAD/DEAH box helicase domain-containing protein